MQRPPHRAALAALTVVLVLALSGCGGGGSLLTIDRVGRADAPKVLKLQINASYSPQAPTPSVAEGFTKLFIAWARKHPDWRIDLNIIGGNMTTTEQARLLEKAKVGEAPDCANVDSFTIPLFIEQGVLQPLDRYIGKDRLDDLFPYVRRVMTGPDGHVYAWWWSTDLRVIYRRTDLVPKPPRTWDELIAYAKAAERKDPKVDGYQFNGGRWEATTFDNLGYFWSQGGKLLDDHGRPVFAEGANRHAMLNVFKFPELRWPSATWPFVARQAGTELLRNVWELPAGLDPHPPPLDDAARASVEAALAVLAARLAALRERHPPVGALLLTGHAHLDLAWRWPLDETRRKARRTLSTALGLLDRHPELYFNQSSAQVFAFLEEDDPALLERIAAQVRDGRFEPIGGMWVEPDCNMPAGESLVRQLLYGQRWFERHFGAPHTVCWLPDCFGFTPALPQLLAGAGGRSARACCRSGTATAAAGRPTRWCCAPPTSPTSPRCRASASAASTTSSGVPRRRGSRCRCGRVSSTWSCTAARSPARRVKRLHRRAERDLVAAEALGALAALAGDELPRSLEPLWRVLLRNEFHDILPGSSIREVYETAEEELASVLAGAREESQRALDALAARRRGCAVRARAC